MAYLMPLSKPLQGALAVTHSSYVLHSECVIMNLSKVLTARSGHQVHHHLFMRSCRIALRLLLLPLRAMIDWNTLINCTACELCCGAALCCPPVARFAALHMDLAIPMGRLQSLLSTSALRASKMISGVW